MNGQNYRVFKSIQKLNCSKFKLCLVLFYFLLQLILNGHQVEGQCASMCECIWRSGKQTALCANQSLINIPSGFSSSTQVLILNNNNFQVLPAKVFQERGLNNLQKVFLSHCKLGVIAEDAFFQLTNLVELDLSFNLLTSVPFESLQHTPFLRKLYLDSNPIQTIRENSFASLQHLTYLNLSNCQIDNIEAGSFRGLSSLEQLKLDGNRLTTLSVAAIQDLVSLYSLDLHRNPWKCDCELKPTRERMQSLRIAFSVPPTCHNPLKVSGLMWNSLEISDFACSPIIISHETQISTSYGSNVSLVCTVKSLPLSRVSWSVEDTIYKNRSALFNSQYDRYIISESYPSGPEIVSSTLTLFNVDHNDGLKNYICFAENQASTTSKNFSLHVTSLPFQTISGWTKMEIAGLVIALLLTFFISCVLITLCILRSRKNIGRKSDSKPALPPIDVLKSIKSITKVHHLSSEGKIINENPLKAKIETVSSSEYSSNGVTPDLTSSTIKPLEYNQMYSPYHNQTGLIQSSPVKSTTELIDEHSGLPPIQNDWMYNNYENFDIFANYNYQDTYNDNVNYNNFDAAYLNSDQRLANPSDKRFCSNSAIQNPNIVNLHHVNVIGQGPYNITHPTIVRYSPDEGYAEEQANVSYVLEGTEV